MKLESIADENCFERYSFEFAGQSVLDLRLMIGQIVTDIREDTDRAVISAKFHNTIVEGLLIMARFARQAKKLSTVALSGGVFCNRFLTERLVRLLKEDGFSVLSNRNFPVNDGCVSVGQAAIAAAVAKRSVS
jgi:hydrogenase maturation protein HypF